MGSILAGFCKTYSPKPILRSTIQRCRAICSYCPDVHRWTKILEFLYCGYGTVINLSGQGHHEKGGWGYGGVLRNQKSSMRTVRGLEEFKFVQYTGSGREILSKFCPTKNIGSGQAIELRVL